jgi:hypothetical protein
MSTIMSMAANIAERVRNNEGDVSAEDVASLSWEVAKSLTDQSFLVGLRHTMGAMDDPERNLGPLVENVVVGAFVPSGVSYLARLVDPTQRRPRNLGQAFAARIPGLQRLTGDVPPALDVFGTPVKYDGNTFVRAISPVSFSGAVENDVVQGLLGSGLHVQRQGAQVRGVKITKDQRDKIEAESGPIIEKVLGIVVKTPDWQNMSQVDKEAAVNKVITLAREKTRVAVAADAELKNLDIPAPTDTQKMLLYMILTDGSRSARWKNLSKEEKLRVMRIPVKMPAPTGAQ